MRHDIFNGKIKGFWLMQVRFCGPDDENFAGVFEAISVLFLYILEH